MKKWVAGMLAVLLLLSGTLAAAQESEGLTDAEIQEAMITREEESETLSSSIRLMAELLQNEDVRSLLQIQDVKDLMNEGAFKVLIWMLQNRSVTMKILKELGVGKKDRDCIGKIWDSAERIRDTKKTWLKTEKGRELLTNLEILKNDPEVAEAANSFSEMINSDDAAAVIKAMGSTARKAASEELPANAVPQNAADLQTERASFTGSLLAELLRVLGNSEWAQKYLPMLLKNEALNRALVILSEDNELNGAIRQEYNTLANDPEIYDFAGRTLRTVADLFRQMGSKPDEPVPAEGTNTGSEEDVP